MEKFIVWYAYRGMETEGRLDLEEPITVTARNKSEALYKFLCYRDFISKSEPYHKSFTEHDKSEHNEGGWGFRVEKLDKDAYISEVQYLKDKYEKEGYSK